MITTLKGDITESDAKYIVHQCNCKSNDAGGLAHTIFNKFPWSNTYNIQSPFCYRRKPGELHILGNGQDKRFVINLYGQNYPGRPASYETEALRNVYFKECLSAIEKMGEAIESIAFPHLIGCGLAGGSWEKYFSFIKELDTNWQTSGINNKIFIVDFN